MGIINLLDISVANLIAAGEVVDRPASVIKELLENSIDAGATALTVEIKCGGITLMRVSDNGRGMSRDDAERCILRHATSKIKEARDLDGIVTLGFRGEALAAISSVSRMRIITRRKEDKVGTEVEVQAGKVISSGDTGCREGTTIIVEELFANVPARRKFLKKDSSEALAIAAVIEKIALSRPDISINFIQDNQPKLQTPGDGKLLSVIYAIFGREFAKKLLPVRSITDGIEVAGYVGRPDNVRVNRNFQNFFINGRYVRSRTATAALEQAFSSYMEAGRFPCCILNIIIHPTFVDVNVHPTKLEVKFSNERVVFDAVYCAVRNAIEQDTSRPEMLFEKEKIEDAALRTYNAFVPVSDRLDKDSRPEQTDIASALSAQEKEGEKIKRASRPYDDLPFFFPENNPADQVKNEEKEEKEAPKRADDEITSFIDALALLGKDGGAFTDKEKEKETEETKIEFASNKDETKKEAPETKTPSGISLGSPYRILGLAFSTYIVVEQGDKLIMIDKHAAHERILFEEMKKNTEKTGSRWTQLLMIPLEIEVSESELSALRDFAGDIKSAGFDFDIDEQALYSGRGNRVLLREIPGSIDEKQASEVLIEMADRLCEGTGDVSVTRTIAFERALYQASCKAAIKAGTNEDESHLRFICERILGSGDIRYCPHGRPVAFEISKGGIEHQFKRS